MAQQAFDRRGLIRWGFGVSGGLLMPGKGFAQSNDAIDILGIRVPTDLAGIKLPSKSLSLLKTIATIIELEKLADERRLPVSSLVIDEDAPLPTSETSLYQAALPRLVTLIDRSEYADPEVADKAGALLADLNASQRVVPDALKDEPRLLRNRDFASLKVEYAALFSSAEIRAEATQTLEWHFKAMRKFKPRYEAVGAAVKVPWYFIGAIHGLESSFNFRAHLHNGDFPLTARTRQVPSGRPLVWMPPDDWASSAKDALKLLGFTGQSDWSFERTLYRFEAYNGFGYRKQGVATPYLWSFSNHYDKGKFTSDGRWNANARSQQCGAAVLLKALVDSGDIVVG
jgi:lysozyme family protein